MAKIWHRPLFVTLVMIMMSGMNALAAASDIFSFSEMQLRATVAGMPSSAAYLTITNHGVSDYTLC